jgi:ribosomal protein L35
MPKGKSAAKTRQAAAKRVKITKGGKGKKMLQKAAKNHLLINKSKRAKKVGRVDASPSKTKILDRLLPNS